MGLSEPIEELDVYGAMAESWSVIVTQWTLSAGPIGGKVTRTSRL